jgi:lipopolysaccharide transport system ATP-binding protein
MSSIIEVNHVSKEFKLGQLQSLTSALRALVTGTEQRRPRSHFLALNDIDFKVQEGEVVGIIGHNGAGKSTLLKILSRITVPTRGSVAVRGRIAPLIEVGAGLIGDLSGRENIFLNGAIFGLSRKQIAKKFDEIVAFAELDKFIDTPLKRYSSGMQMRLGFSIAISVDADILIVDEVLAVGDVAFQKKCLSKMEDIIVGGHRTVLVVGHNIRQLERMCSRMLLMNQGRILIDGDPGEVCNRFFEETGQKISSQAAAGPRTVRPVIDLGIVRLLSVDVIGAPTDDGSSSIPIHGGMRVRFTIEATRRIARPEFVIGAHTMDMVYVFSMTSAATTSLVELPEGVSEIECDIPEIPLAPGEYEISMAVYDQLRNMLWGANNLHPFRITPEDITRVHDVGLTHLKCGWHIRAAGCSQTTQPVYAAHAVKAVAKRAV